MRWIALDAMGGDFAPRAPVEAAWRTAREGGAGVLLVGDEAALTGELRRRPALPAGLRVVHAGARVGMDESPTALLRDKPDASVRVACERVAAGEADAVISAGHTGATMVAGKHVLGTLEGVDRPALATALPLKRGACLLLDSGANPDCRPGTLVQFARMGALYARTVWGLERPRVALLNIGGEAGKGNELVRQAYPLLADSGLHFVGNAEPRDLFRGRADVVVCDGFTGNLVLKTAEAAGAQVGLLMKDGFARSPVSRLGFWLLRGFFRELARRTDHREVGGSLLLGLKGVAIVAHGAASARTLHNALHLARRCAERDLVAALAAEFSRDEGAPGGGRHTASA